MIGQMFKVSTYHGSSHLTPPSSTEPSSTEPSSPVALAARQEDNPLHELRCAEARQRRLSHLLLRSHLPQQDPRGGIRSIQKRKRAPILCFQVLY